MAGAIHMVIVRDHRVNAGSRSICQYARMQHEGSRHSHCSSLLCEIGLPAAQPARVDGSQAEAIHIHHGEVCNHVDAIGASAISKRRLPCSPAQEDLQGSGAHLDDVAGLELSKTVMS